MISVRDISLSYGGQTLFENASLQINDGDRFALIGPNGSGKSTLFRLILGEVEPDRGRVEMKRGTVIGYLPQENAPVSDRTVLESALEDFDSPDDRITARTKSVLMGLGFKVPDFTKPMRELSGGWAMRTALARLLVKDPDILLLDEPTNHLDLYSLLWFRDYLLEYRGTVVVISHDRTFVNTVCQKIISVQESALKVYHGNYEYFSREREDEKKRLEASYRTQQAKMGQMQEFIDRNRARLSTARRAQSMMKRLDRVERIELPSDPKLLKIRLPQPARGGKEGLRLTGVCKSYGKVSVYHNLDFSVPRGASMALVGPNGAGKSTLLKIIAGVLPFESGERTPGYNMTIGYHSQHRAGTMDENRTVLEEATAGSKERTTEFVRTVLGSFLFPGDDVFKKVKVLSGGEKSRLSLVKILLDPPSFLLLDEPTTHLDMDSVDALINALAKFEGTMAFISHDIHFINALAKQVVHVDRGRVTVYPGNFELFQWRLKKAEEDAAPPAGKISRHAPRR
jgi:ATP-binding cassette subfamily F protein 3